MEFIIQFIVALFATLSFAVIFSAPKKELFYCGFTGALGWIIYYIMVQFDKMRIHQMLHFYPHQQQSNIPQN